MLSRRCWINWIIQGVAWRVITRYDCVLSLGQLLRDSSLLFLTSAVEYSLLPTLIQLLRTGNRWGLSQVSAQGYKSLVLLCLPWLEPTQDSSGDHFMCSLVGQATVHCRCVKLLQAVHKSWMLGVFSEWAWQGFKVSSGPLLPLFFIEDGPDTCSLLTQAYRVQSKLANWVRGGSLRRFSLSLGPSDLGYKGSCASYKLPEFLRKALKFGHYTHGQLGESWRTITCIMY